MLYHVIAISTNDSLSLLQQQQQLQPHDNLLVKYLFYMNNVVAAIAYADTCTHHTPSLHANKPNKPEQKPA